ncbi:hypothetical protein SH661x_002223 [Planctomicrobium sp. SH661]|uniref:hypothetical protein n=1 Tax=Planctomicrobium sp. SH661 TaxID=3448124 RepID=UPI003F5B7BEA
MSSLKMRCEFINVLGAAGLLLLLSGCAKVAEGPVRYQVSGQVTFDGQPVPHGSIIFDPDVQAGNSGPQGSAEIINGSYSTALHRGTGVVGGPMLITVTGMKNQNVLEGEDPGLLFKDFSLKQDIPKEKFVLDVLVPREAGRR